MSLWHRLDDWERLATVYVLLGGLWLAWSHLQAEHHRHRDRRDRQQVTLTEEALQHLEDDGELELYRWHGGTLVLEASAEDPTEHPPGEA